MNRGWIGVDLDGTMAHYEKFVAPDVIGEPIPEMLTRVKQWLKNGVQVKVFTARVYPYAVDAHMNSYGMAPEDLKTYKKQYDDSREAFLAIERWCEKHIGVVLPITCIKDYHMFQLWDDRAIQIIPNTGKRADGEN